MEFLEDQQNTESSEWTVDTKACELKIEIPTFIFSLNIKFISYLFKKYK